MILPPLRILLLLLLTGAAGAAFAAPLPGFTARYQLLRGDSAIGEATLTLAPAGNNTWTFTTESKGTSGLAALLGADVHEVSHFRWKNDLPEGLSYDYALDAAIKHKERHVRFDWSSNTINVDDKGPHRFAAQPGALERHTVVLAIAAGLADGKRDFALPVAVRDRIQTQRFVVKGNETVQVPAGSYAATRVSRVGDDSTFDGWFVPGKLPVPVQLSQHDNGDFTMKLESYSAQ